MRRFDASFGRIARVGLLSLVSMAALTFGGARPLAAREQPTFGTVHVPVAARLIARGAVLTDDDITFEDRPVVRGMTIDTAVAPGWVARRIINQGEILRPPAVEAPIAVAANGPLDISYSDGTVALSLRGIAMRAAAVGERISVRLDDGRHLDVIVVAPGKARIL